MHIILCCVLHNPDKSLYIIYMHHMRNRVVEGFFMHYTFTGPEKHVGEIFRKVFL